MEQIIKGLIVGFSIAAPVGPIGLLCIRRSLAYGSTAGFLSGLGAASADAVYGFIAAFGITAILDILTAGQTILRLFGGLFLCYLGVQTCRTDVVSKEAKIDKDGLWGAYFSVFLLTLTNPMTILSFTAIFAGLGIGQSTGDYTSATKFVTGVFGGSAAWWLLLSGSVSKLRAYLDMQQLGWINKASGSIITVFGLTVLITCFT
jgi:threonine/homoserine/homoserine lactone efflux protein